MDVSVSDIILSIEGLETRFGSRTIHSDLDLQLQRGELLVLFGGSGTGKSTLLRAIIGLDRPYHGRIVFDGKEVAQDEEQAWRDLRRHIAYSFQNGALFDSLTVGENLEYPLREASSMSPEKRREAAASMLERVGLPGIEHLYPAELSGGMQKRVGLARTLMLDPALILYDEPTAGLDPANSKKMADLMRELKQRGKSAILVTHDVPCALAVGDRIAFLQAGKIAVIQTRAELDANPDPRLKSYMDGEIE